MISSTASPIRRMGTSVEDDWRESSRRVPTNAVTFVVQVVACTSAALIRPNSYLLLSFTSSYGAENG